MNLQQGDSVLIDHDRNDGVTLTDLQVWRSRPRENQPPEQVDISQDVARVTVSSETIIVTGLDGTRVKASHAPESSPGMRTGIVESVTPATPPRSRQPSSPSVVSPKLTLGKHAITLTFDHADFITADKPQS